VSGESRSLPIDEVRPTQLYLSAEKLSAVLGSADGSLDPGVLPAFEYDGEWHFSDGHTRAFAASLGGVEELRIERDREVREAYDFDLYRECIEWCRRAGVQSVADFSGRVLPHEEFEEAWIERCRRRRER
jgi:hypothetical protein